MRRHETVLFPTWLAVPLLVLGSVFLIVAPVFVEWMTYAFVLIIAVASGLFSFWRYRTTIVERSDEAVVVRFERR